MVAAIFFLRHSLIHWHDMGYMTLLFMWIRLSLLAVCPPISMVLPNVRYAYLFLPFYLFKMPQKSNLMVQKPRMESGALDPSR